MDIARVFTSLGRAGVTINIHGTAEDPLFQANQIGALLGMTNIRATIKDFDDDEVSVNTVYTNGRTVTCLTDLGLTRLLMTSRMPLARPFQKWVAQMVREIRLSGRHDLELRCKNIEESSREALMEKDSEIASQCEALKNQLIVHDLHVAELHRFRTKVYDEVPKLDNVYINKERSELAGDAHKIGKAFDEKKRSSQFNTGSAQGSRMIHVRATHNAKIVEDIVKVVQKRYHIANGHGGVEHYNNNVEHSVDVIDISATVVDTLASSFEYMTRSALFDKVIENLRIIQDTEEETVIGVDDHEDEDEAEDEDGPEEKIPTGGNPVSAFANGLLETTGVAKDCVLVSELFSAYTVRAQVGQPGRMKKADFFRYAKAHFLALQSADRSVMFHDCITRCRRRNGAEDSQKNVVKGVRWLLAASTGLGLEPPFVVDP